uniref:Replication stress response regulator SDE2 n=1 Tax=Taeniopygia guttata TaxID=59729 RepID=A0A674HHK3_TAEGU
MCVRVYVCIYIYIYIYICIHCGRLTLAGLQGHPKVALSLLFSARQGRENVTEWVKGRDKERGDLSAVTITGKTGLNIPEESLYVKCNGQLASDEDELQSGVVYSLEPRLCGGKGGFGSMLRALGAQIEKTTNREACRDLSGRRLRDVNHEKAMAEWVKKQAEREAEKEQRRLERLQRKLAEPRHTFTDPEYERQYREMAERQEESLRIGTAAWPPLLRAHGRKGLRYTLQINVHLSCARPGLDEVTGSGCEDDNKDDSPCASDRSCPSGSSANGNVGNSDECSSSSVASAEDSPSTSASEKPLEQLEGPGKGLQGEVCTGGKAEILSEEKSKMTEAPKEDIQGKNGPQESHSVPESIVQVLLEPLFFLECFSQMFFSFQEVEPIDLLAFNSAAELEALGLEKLKMGLMSLGLKCGGTLKERAARLFSVRGLTRDQIKPSLFAKPPKGKTSG